MEKIANYYKNDDLHILFTDKLTEKTFSINTRNGNGSVILDLQEVLYELLGNEITWINKEYKKPLLDEIIDTIILENEKPRYFDLIIWLLDD